jgi:phosphoribosylformylglycinamidine cyclo-ligase
MPLIFLDYLATGKISRKKIIEIVGGIGAACKEAGCALIGGETAEMPGFYRDDEYDLSGFGAGIFDLPKEITGKKIASGDQIIGLAASGLHSNGYSLVRKICFEVLKLTVDSHVEELGTTLGEELLKPTEIYVKPILKLIETSDVHGLVNITGGGIPDNFDRVVPIDCCAVISKGVIPQLPIFQFLQDAGNVTDPEMFRAFNKGVGFSVIVADEDCEKAIDILANAGSEPFYMGEVVNRGTDGQSVEIL